MLHKIIYYTKNCAPLCTQLNSSLVKVGVDRAGQLGLGVIPTVSLGILKRVEPGMCISMYLRQLVYRVPIKTVGPRTI